MAARSPLNASPWIWRSAGRTPASSQSVQYASTRTAASEQGFRHECGRLRELDQFADGASYLLGHNIIGSMSDLMAADPSLRLLKLPVIDTLRLSPLAFPRNPYHHLVIIRTEDSGGGGSTIPRWIPVSRSMSFGIRSMPWQSLHRICLQPGTGTALPHLTARIGQSTNSSRIFAGPVGRPTRRRTRRSGGCLTAAAAILHQGHSCGDRGRERGAWLETCICAGVALSGRRQFGHSPLGAPSIPRNRRDCQEAEGHRLHGSGLQLVPGKA